MRMTTARSPGLRASFDRAGLSGWRLPLLLAALFVGIGGRIVYGLGAPFWFDETFTGVIAGQPTVARLFDWCLHELTGPAFYGPMWLWEKLAGSSNFALRLPGLTLAIVTPLAILRWGDRDADLRLWWAVFLLLWSPIFAMAGEARAYPEIFALAAGQAVLFARLLDRPGIGRASAWVVISALGVLCNYWAAIPAIVQGLAFLAVHRFRAIRTWPALLFLIPVLIWSRFHLPMVLAFTVGNSSGVAGLPLSDLVKVPSFILGVGLNGALLFVVVLGSLAIEWKRERSDRPQAMTPERGLALCGLASVAIIIVLAFVRPNFGPRYLTAAMPSFLFALALWARWMTARNAKAVVLVMAIMFTTAIGVMVSILRDPDREDRRVFELERPSAWIAERAPERLVMLWDNTVGERSDADRLAEVGGYFLRRDGLAPDVSVARADAGGDPNRAVLALATARRESAIIWFANDKLPDDRVPRIEQYDPSFECRNFGRREITMMACRQRR